MKKLLLITLIIVASIMTACESEDLSTSNQLANSNDKEKVVKHCMEFKDPKQFENYLKYVEKKKSMDKTRAYDDEEEEFEEEIIDLEELEEQQQDLESLADIEESCDEEWDEEDEMTDDEFDAYEAAELLMDPALKRVMDPTLQIKVGDNYYKITDEGTFVSNNTEDINDAIRDLDPNEKASLETGESKVLPNGVVFINSFGAGSVTTTITSVDNNSNSSENYTPSLHNNYNVNSYKWQNNSIWQKCWDFIRGKDVSKENNFDSSHRVKVEVFKINYGFYKSCGIKVRLQKSKHFLGIKYWKDMRADKLAIGFNKLQGKLELDNPLSYMQFSAPSYWKNFTSNVHGFTSDFVFNKYEAIPMIKDWVNELYYFLPKINIVGNSIINKSDIDRLYNAPADAIFNFLKSQENRVFDSIHNILIHSTDPRLVSLVWGMDEINFTKENNYIIGVKEYSDSKCKAVYFNRSFGLSFINGIISPFTPTDFKIDELDCFGAAKYNNQWKGIRIYR